MNFKLLDLQLVCTLLVVLVVVVSVTLSVQDSGAFPKAGHMDQDFDGVYLDVDVSYARDLDVVLLTIVVLSIADEYANVELYQKEVGEEYASMINDIAHEHAVQELVQLPVPIMPCGHHT